MKECKCEENLNPLNLEGGDVVEQTSGYSKGNLYLVTEASGKLTMHNLHDGNVWSTEKLMGSSGVIFKKVNVYFKREDC